MEGIVYESSLVSFIALTLFIGGGMAWASGAAVARGWESKGFLVAYAALLACVERFLQFALYEGTLLSLRFWVTSFLILLAFAWIGFALKRREQMSRQYKSVLGH